MPLKRTRSKSGGAQGRNWLYSPKFKSGDHAPDKQRYELLLLNPDGTYIDKPIVVYHGKVNTHDVDKPKGTQKRDMVDGKGVLVFDEKGEPVMEYANEGFQFKSYQFLDVEKSSPYKGVQGKLQSVVSPIKVIYELPDIQYMHANQPTFKNRPAIWNITKLDGAAENAAAKVEIHTYQVGEAVKAKLYNHGRYYDGKVTKVHGDGKLDPKVAAYDITFNDGDKGKYAKAREMQKTTANPQQGKGGRKKSRRKRNRKTKKRRRRRR